MFAYQLRARGRLACLMRRDQKFHSLTDFTVRYGGIGDQGFHRTEQLAIQIGPMDQHLLGILRRVVPYVGHAAADHEQQSVGTQRRSQVWRWDRKLFAEMAPQHRRHNAYCLQQASAHAQKANLQRQPQLQLGSATIFNDADLRFREREECFQFWNCREILPYVIAPKSSGPP